jgi:hypothetical protein
MEKRGQVWVETVIYTLIGLAILTTIIAVITPKISQVSDNIIITQTIEAMNKLNEQIRDTLTYPGNQREVLVYVKKGEYTIDGFNNSIYYTLKNTNLKYSEPNATISEGDLTLITLPKGNKKYDIKIFLNYSSFNLTYANKDSVEVLTSAPTAYSLLILNKDGKTLNFEQK